MCLVADIDHTRSIDIRAPLALFGVAIGLVSLSVLAQAACNVRGEFCGYPAWAANAFSDPFHRVPEAWLERPTNPPAYLRTALGVLPDS